MNVKLLEEVKRHIIEEPRRFIMGRWRIEAEPGEWLHGLEERVDAKRRKAPPCGTAACLAGWTCIIGKPERETPMVNVPEEAERLLGLTNKQSRKLFWVDEWPKHWRDKWFATHSLPERAQIAGRVIDRFIKSNQH